MARPPPLLRALLALALMLCMGGEALAGAWTRAEGAGQLIMTSGRRMAPIGAFVSNLAEEDVTFTSVYAEYGLFDGTTIGGTAFLELSPLDPDAGSANLGAFVRQRLWQTDSGHVASIEAAALGPVESWMHAGWGASKPDSVPEASLRALYGKGFWGGWGTAFVNAEVGYSWRGEGAADEIRTSLSAGVAPWKCCMAILSLHGAFPVEGGEDPSLKLAPTLAYTIWPTWPENGKKPRPPINPTTVAIGVSYDLLNRGEGLGVQVGIWQPF